MIPSAPAALVCLDLQRARLTNAAFLAPALEAADACRQVLAQARQRRWPVLHVHRREALAEHGRPISGLEPLPSEPVYLRPGPSAFSHSAFTRHVLALGGPLALIGFSLNDTILATAFAAADVRLQTEVLLDAVAIDVHDEAARQALISPLATLAPACRLIQSPELFQEEAAPYVAANIP